ncbi:hypothetical protein [Paenibacillus sp. R14(2021)]|uniref:hypothetical protein n=1 Tax=Paenibacillus sp. R14(2021) TaxID=2859228 RepID=UPI0021574E6E|nr:hypothetical protein [Paenibacillus sp. R14(2021)]
MDEIIQDSPEKAHERSMRPRGTKDYYKEKLSGQNVLVGSLRQVEQLDAALRYGFYHVPLENFTDHTLLSQLEYVALYQSIGKFQSSGLEAGVHWYGRIRDWKVVRRHEIQELPARLGTEEKLYVKFTLEQWLKRATPIRPGGRGIYKLLCTSKYVFDRAVEIAELRLRTQEEITLWREKRRQGKINVELNHEFVDLASGVLDIGIK